MNSVVRKSTHEIRVASGRCLPQTGLPRWAGALAVCLGLVLAANLHASDRWETLEAIHWVENPENSPAPGPFGELGAYQFRRSTWYTYTSVPFEYARERTHSDAVAIKHYEWLKRGFERAGLAVTPYRIALAWNAGLSATLSGRIPAATHQYARRVANIVESLKQRTARNEGQ
ncbi:MAG TPA: hypothetical protein PLV87_13535 [Opitutaceae bacterium]|nr:hypothetical protein [Opitutaceae bacterium]